MVVYIIPNRHQLFPATKQPLSTFGTRSATTVAQADGSGGREGHHVEVFDG
jgi:hypothetical protein